MFPISAKVSILPRVLPGLEELCPPQPEPEQVLREDREARRARVEPKEGLSLGDEPRQGQQDGRGGPEVVAEGPHGHQEGNAPAS